MELSHIDHLVLTVSDFDRTVEFYTRVFGMCAIGRSLFFGNQKINLHCFAGELQPAAGRPTIGSADFCLICHGTMPELLATLQQRGAAVLLGPVRRTGAIGAMESVYLRDPDGNLIELAIPDAR